tara:strand:- start:314 stop:535 length:222 start_codon:yes stop_codon:yes gene_type:complete
MFRNKAAWRESLVDTGIGLIVNLPLTWASIAFGFYLELSVSEFALFQTFVFTTASLIRKYKIRSHFATILSQK